MAELPAYRSDLISSSKENGLSVGPKRLIGTPSASQRNLKKKRAVEMMMTVVNACVGDGGGCVHYRSLSPTWSLH